jgi:propionyl-CoA carboxylase alpha chain
MGIDRLLIANRGEIAVRIARTAHRMGVDTVGVYSEPDVNALHVDSVDVAVALGGSAPGESYLRADAVLAAAVETGCDAVHPGYGFLAENADFARQVTEAGLTWVGPTPEQITLLGDKVAAKKAAIDAGVPTAPVFDAAPGDIPDDVPLPALVKAAAGGGGRGMRIVRDAAELGEAVEAASREAASAFGDGTVFIEPYIENGRHVEVQIMGDRHGSVVHFGERECSIQRRNQKVVEEAPSAGISDEIRTALHEGAVALASHVGYENAGTVEFLVGDDGTLNFLEVNTRLQVEHPVTEAVTGFDLVEVQLRVAAGEALPVSQDDISVDGHAIEVRLVAEDPAADWLPSTGEVTAFDIGEGVRVDTGFRAGAIVSPDYDSLLAKIIAVGAERDEAARVLARALRTSAVTGIRTNLASLEAICREPDFLAARTPTSYLGAHPEVLTPSGPEGDDLVALLLGGVFALEAVATERRDVLNFAPSGWRNVRTVGQRQVMLRDGEVHPVEYAFRTGDRVDVLVGPWPEPTDDGTLSPDERRAVSVRLLRRSDTEQVVEVDGRRHVVTTRVDGDHVETSSAAGSAAWERAERFVDHDAEDEAGGPHCPLPGTVIAVHVEAGDEVANGQLLMVVEAMKMEHKIIASHDATVAAVHFTVGDRVDQGDLLVALD